MPAGQSPLSTTSHIDSVPQLHANAPIQGQTQDAHIGHATAPTDGIQIHAQADTATPIPQEQKRDSYIGHANAPTDGTQIHAQANTATPIMREQKRHSYIGHANTPTDCTQIHAQANTATPIVQEQKRDSYIGHANAPTDGTQIHTQANTATPIIREQKRDSYIGHANAPTDGTQIDAQANTATPIIQEQRPNTHIGHASAPTDGTQFHAQANTATPIIREQMRDSHIGHANAPTDGTQVHTEAETATPIHPALNNLAELRDIYNEVQSSGHYNFAGVRRPVPSGLNVQAWRSYLSEYTDNQITDYLEFGWPVNFTRGSPLISSNTNHFSATAYPEHVDFYIATELAQLYRRSLNHQAALCVHYGKAHPGVGQWGVPLQNGSVKRVPPITH